MECKVNFLLTASQNLWYADVSMKCKSRSLVCSFPGCGRLRSKSGTKLCPGHYYRKRHDLPMKSPLRDWEPQKLICSVPNCNTKAVTKGLCQKHFDKSISKTRTAKWAAKAKKYAKTQRKAGLCVYYKCQNPPEQGKAHCSIHLKKHRNSRPPEHRTVAAHLQFIQRGTSTYKNMPFFDGWNPKTGGSTRAGYIWILENLGPRPTNGKHELHIIDRAIGFMPGNLRWVPCVLHKREEFINQVILENQTLRTENQRLKEYLEAALIPS